jgi:restriction system protein
MAVPGYQDLMLPLLQLAADGQERTSADLRETLAERMQVSLEDQADLLESGRPRFANRVAWALIYLVKALLLEKTARDCYRIGPRGLEVLRERPERIDNAFLKRYPEYQAFVENRPKPGSPAAVHEIGPPESTPEEQLEGAYRKLRQSLADDLLKRTRGGSARFFEHLVVDLLVAMGYGGSRTDAAQVVGKSGDEGIDGVIKEDRLGLDMVYVQAKKWEGSVGPGEIDKFVGSLSRKKAHKGVFITTGTFTPGALNAARDATVRIVLIDGEQLAQLMIDHGVGVANDETYTVKRLDSDYFEEE